MVGFEFDGQLQAGCGSSPTSTLRQRVTPDGSHAQIP
jgi:hypothetical protein